MEKLARELEELVSGLNFDRHLTNNNFECIVYDQRNKIMTLEKKVLHHKDLTTIFSFADRYNLEIEISVLPMENICYIELKKY